MRWGTGARAVVRVAAVLALFTASGCAGRHRLSSHDFSGRALAVVHVAPQSGEVRTGSVPAGRDRMQGAMAPAPVGLDTRVPGRSASESQVREQLDSAARRVSVGSRLAERTASRATSYMGARRVAAPSAADYVMDLRVRNYGVITASANAEPALFLEADVVLLDAATGAQLWTTRVNGWDRITSASASVAPSGTVSTADIERALERVVDASADAVTDELRSRLGRGSSH